MELTVTRIIANKYERCLKGPQEAEKNICQFDKCLTGIFISFGFEFLAGLDIFQLIHPIQFPLFRVVRGQPAGGFGDCVIGGRVQVSVGCESQIPNCISATKMHFN